VIVVFDEGCDSALEIAGSIVVLEQDAALEREMPALDLALCPVPELARRIERLEKDLGAGRLLLGLPQSGAGSFRYELTRERS
jgi:hypothetical protein